MSRLVGAVLDAGAVRCDADLGPSYQRGRPAVVGCSPITVTLRTYIRP